MSNWAIEAKELVKQFPQRAAANKPSNGAESPAVETTPGNASGIQPPAARRRLWPFGKRAPRPLFTAVAGVSLQIEAGEIFGLLGPNGAGKSTTIRMLCTLLEPTSGTALVNGYDIRKQASQVRQNLGTVLAGERSIYWKLTARENLEYFAALYHIPPATARKRIDALLERMELTTRADDLVEKFSTGMKQRVAISKALLASPPIILLDEPTLGLDPQAARMVRQLIGELRAEGHTILLTTHYMEEADQLSDRIGIIDQGRIIALDTPAALKERIQHKDVLRLEVSGWHEELAGELRQIPQVDQLATRPLEAEALYEVSLHTANSRAVLPGVIERLNVNGTRLVNMNVLKPTLEDVFIHLTGKALRD